MSRLPAITLGVLLALTLAFAAAACGDDDGGGDGDGNGSPTGGAVDPEAYYQDVDRIQNSLTEQLDIIGEQSETAFGDPDAAQSSLSQAQAAVESALEDLDALEPPSVARSAHGSMISAAETMNSALEGMVADLAQVDTDEEFQDFKDSVLRQDSAYTLAAEEVRDACADMQSAADNSQVDVVYQCPV